MANEQTVDKDLADLQRFFGEGGEYQFTFDSTGRYRILVKKGTTEQRYFYVYPDGRNWDILTKTQYVNQIRKDFANKKENLRTQLWQQGLMGDAEYNTKNEAALTSAILASGNNFTAEQIDSFQFDNKTTFTPYTQWASGMAARGAGLQGGGQPTAVETARTQADQDIDTFFNDMLDRPASAEEKDKYYKALRKEEKKAKRTTTGGVVKDTLLDAEDLFRIRTEILKPSVTGTGLEGITKSNGKIAQGISSLKSYANDYGINLTTADALNKVMGGLVPGKADSLANQQNAIREMSKSFYPNLAPQIDAGIKVSDIGNQFAYYKGQILEKPDNIYTMSDPQIQKALSNSGKSGVMSRDEFELMIRTSPETKSEWLKTKGAREQASSFANSILKSFGLMA